MAAQTCPACKSEFDAPAEGPSCPSCDHQLPKELIPVDKQEVLAGEMVTNWEMMVERLKENRVVARCIENKFLTSIGLALLLVLSVVLYSYSGGTSEAPDFTLKDTSGKTFSLSDYEDEKVIILDFMFTSCSTCKKYTKDTLDPYSKEMPDDVVIISISVFGKDSKSQLQDHAKKHKWRHALGDKDGKIEKQYQVSTTPKTLIIDKDGRITFEQTGIIGKKDLDEEVEAARSGTANFEKVQDTHIFLFAITTGFIVFFSPCAFPMLPGYMTYYLANKKRSSEITMEGKVREALPAGLAAGAGLMTTLLLIGLLIVLLISLIGGIIPILEFVIGLILVILGIAMFRDISLEPAIMPFRKVWAKGLGLIPTKAKASVGLSVERGIQRYVRPDFSFEKSKEEGLGGLYLYGMGYGTAASGCVAPIVAGLLAASLALNLLGGIIVFVLFAASAGILMITVTLMVAVAEDSIIHRLKASTEKIRMFGGLVMVIVGIYLMTYYLRV